MLLLVGTPPRLTRSLSQRGPAFVSVTKSPPLLPLKPEPPDLTPVKQSEPVIEALSPSDLPPPDPPFKALTPPEPPDPPDATFDFGSLLLFNPPDVFLFIAPFFGISFRPSPQNFIQISNLKPPSRMVSKNGGGGGGVPVSASDTSFAYGLLSPVVYRSLFGCVEWPSFDLPAAPPSKVLHVHLSSLSIFSATVEWIRQLFVWVMLELGFMTLDGDVPMDLVTSGSTFATSSGIYIALVRSTAVCSFLTGSIPAVGVAFLYLYSWWQVEEKLIVIFRPMNMVVAGYDFLLVPRLKQSPFLMFPLLWSELDEQASLVLQGSSSHRMLLSAYGAVCVVLGVTLDAIFQEAYDAAVVRFHMVSFCDMYRHSIFYVIIVVVVCLALSSLYPSLMEFKLI